ncbi:hypothetical protein [Phocaeicola oris]|uniref:hypothetical protein n=1 Tax=Phocaeicola oris TaxID=2896850 RepID=UPI00234F0149|nr:hypothetical protein [Phocaeicola oris]MCE2616638.1 hypothetical protein [Phocaeicola oris]
MEKLFCIYLKRVGRESVSYRFSSFIIFCGYKYNQEKKLIHVRGTHYSRTWYTLLTHVVHIAHARGAHGSRTWYT